MDNKINSAGNMQKRRWLKYMKCNPKSWRQPLRKISSNSNGFFKNIYTYIRPYIPRNTNGIKFDLFHKLIMQHPQFFDNNSSSIVISRYMNGPAKASSNIVEQIKTTTTSLFCARHRVNKRQKDAQLQAFV